MCININNINNTEGLQYRAWKYNELQITAQAAKFNDLGLYVPCAEIQHD